MGRIQWIKSAKFRELLAYSGLSPEPKAFPPKV
jgi:hypothetical protein